MSSRPQFFVLTAVVLLLLAGTDLLAIDLFSSFLCDEGRLSGSSKASPDEDCFCCCAHVVHSTPLVYRPLQMINTFDPAIQPVPRSPELTSVYHPPRG
jgi:hypothetical protein